MYENKLVAAIKVDGKVLREIDGTVILPFGSEYEILFKNLNTARVAIQIKIDGRDILGERLIVDGLTDATVTRFINNNNLTSGNRLKFIELSEDIEKYRGTKLEDGLIHIEFEYERNDKISHPHWGNPHDCHPYDWPSNQPVWISPLWMQNPQVIPLTTYCSQLIASGADHSVSMSGITVPGSESHQQFNKTLGFISDGRTHSMVFKLVGEIKSGKNTHRVSSTLTTKDKIVCGTCGKKNHSSSKYCNKCGTSLIVI